MYISPRTEAVTLSAFLCAIAIATAIHASSREDRVLSIGGAVTEIIFALGEEDRLVGRDSTSSYPETALDLPDVGYMGALSPEGVLSVAPDLIIATDGAGPPETIEVLKDASVPLVTVPALYTAEGLSRKIEVVGNALGVPKKAEVLAKEVADSMKEAEASARVDAPKRVMFIISSRGGRIMASGEDTAADAIIKLAGGVNAVTGFGGYKALTDEAADDAKPDVILMMDRGGDHASTNEELFALPSLSATPAAEAGSVIRMDGLFLLGFGPRTADAIKELNAALYGG